ncbi:acetyltransferase AlgX (SGNH hydrolase-like protein) [Rhodobacter viridis]|uniref:Acetyltransferase AlgX (SGNH hydrolase-like protein) n=1 Tax=Rhodobacter viridis TaxID=1054202 RepID=A0A318U1I2_9RHOB|nr:hypothetical protein [Rhodobacter viridis]PYF11820.1 acetyltransferase AlgX (SGNH hydrolase-like protein) [Rhodobacter viridis]
MSDFAPPLSGATDHADLPVTNGILKGRDGWLFLWDGSNEVHRYYTEPEFFAAPQVAGWAALLKGRSERCARMGAEYRHLVVPDKISVYPQYLPVTLPHYGGHPTAQFSRALSGDAAYVDILPDLRGERGNWAERVERGGGEAVGSDVFFFKTDSHWTFEGCQVGYLRLCESLGVTPCDLSKARPGAGREMTLDLGGKLSPPVLEHARFGRVLRQSKRQRENEMVRYNEREGLAKGAPAFVGCMVHNHNAQPQAIQKRVVVFGDSFCEFRGHLLTAMLSETFRDVHFVWSTSLDWGFIEALNPDIVITEIAERFVNRLPTDDFTVDPA